MKPVNEPKPLYRGRFAPSPSGPLHFGSLVCALASYLDAKAHCGRWLVRIEDIDPPREQEGAASSILRTLEAHGMLWDEEVLFQSRRSEAYLEALAYLSKSGLVYPCTCTRKRLSASNGLYDGHCLHTPPAKHQAAALRLNLAAATEADAVMESSFVDLLKGKQTSNLARTGDFIIHRKDNLFAYQLVVVIDDIAQDITHVVRGADLLDSTPQQRFLFQLFGKRLPAYAHLPLVVDAQGSKLSKQNRAKALINNNAANNLHAALALLDLHPPKDLPNETHAILEWAITQWKLENVPQCSSITAPSHTM